MKTLLVIPCYQCEKQVQRVIQTLISNPKLMAFLSEVLILDNQSPDGTARAAARKVYDLNGGDKFKVAVNDKNYGMGGSHKVGFFYALKNDFDYMAVLHGDDQGEVNDLIALIEAAKERPEMSAILGARFMPGSSLKGYSKIRILGNLTFNFLYSLGFRKIIWDLGSGINLFKVSDHQWDKIKILSHQFSFNYDLLFYYHSNKKNTLYLPINWRETDQVSNVKNWSIGLKALELFFNFLLYSKTTHEEPFAHYSFVELKHAY